MAGERKGVCGSNPDLIIVKKSPETALVFCVVLG
jgi:hypothetical protein